MFLNFWNILTFILILNMLYYDNLLQRSDRRCLHYSCYPQKGLRNRNSSFFLKFYGLLIGCFVHFETNLNEEFSLNWVLFLQRTFILAPLSDHIFNSIKTMREFQEWNILIDILLILQTNIILVFVSPRFW